MKLDEEGYKAMAIVIALNTRMGGISGEYFTDNKDGSRIPIIKTRKKKDGSFEISYYKCKDGHELTADELADANKIAQKTALKYVEIPLI